ncbi:MAG TPA: CPBP family intramembrane glutamic endopeptidase [Thermoanaerobaculia bacterium]|nr:CPBP family intramembrane glutamic endopeptidase [Thermoanaerobaculia bacterium]
MFFYVATLIGLLWLRFPFIQWRGLVCVVVATILTVGIFERFRWPLGLFVPPRLALPELLKGLLWGSVLVAAGAGLVVLSTNVRHEPGRGFPWLELFAVFLPAAIHEELLFRGYAFQKLYRWKRGFAILFIAVLFAALHMGNTSVTPLGLANIFLGGILLGLAYARYERLWFPIGLHLAWNLMSGPILGHEVSGYEAVMTVLTEEGTGPELLTGGEFGIEGSVWMTVMELGAIGLLWLRAKNAE